MRPKEGWLVLIVAVLAVPVVQGQEIALGEPSVDSHRVGNLLGTLGIDTRCDNHACDRLRVDDGQNPSNVLDTTPGNGSADSLYWGASLLWHQGNDGPGSGLIADHLDGLDSTDFSRNNHDHDDLYLTPTSADGRYLPLGGKSVDADRVDGLDSLQLARLDVDVAFQKEVEVKEKLKVSGLANCDGLRTDSKGVLSCKQGSEPSSPMTTCSYINDLHSNALNHNHWSWQVGQCDRGFLGPDCVGVLGRASANGADEDWEVLNAGETDNKGHLFPNGGMSWWIGTAAGSGVFLRATYFCP